jgi:hypothetical protein
MYHAFEVLQDAWDEDLDTALLQLACLQVLLTYNRWYLRN